MKFGQLASSKLVRKRCHDVIATAVWMVVAAFVAFVELLGSLADQFRWGPASKRRSK